MVMETKTKKFATPMNAQWIVKAAGESTALAPPFVAVVPKPVFSLSQWLPKMVAKLALRLTVPRMSINAAKNHVSAIARATGRTGAAALAQVGQTVVQVAKRIALMSLTILAPRVDASAHMQMERSKRMIATCLAAQRTVRASGVSLASAKVRT